MELIFFFNKANNIIIMIVVIIRNIDDDGVSINYLWQLKAAATFWAKWASFLSIQVKGFTKLDKKTYWWYLYSYI